MGLFFLGLVLRFIQIQGFLDALADGAQDLDTREALVVRLDQRPRRRTGTRAVDHVADGGMILPALLAVAPVLGGDLEAFELDLLAFLEAPQLLLVADLQPELDDNRTVAVQISCSKSLISV
jgi:hypothetical protein